MTPNESPLNAQSDSPIVGIDLGTTYSLVAILEQGRPRCLPNVLGETLTPSAVSVGDDGSLLVGAAARARAVTHPEITASSFKRCMGTEQVITIGPHAFSAVELSSMVLRALKADAESALGRAVADAVITVPAYFGEAQRQATRAAAELAGLTVRRLVNEPTAAALAYGLAHREHDMRVVVLDLGGGTFDVTVLQITEGVVEVSATSGDCRLGGDDFTQLLADWVFERVRVDRGINLRRDAVLCARLLEAASRAKHELSHRETTDIAIHAIPSWLGSRSVQFRIERQVAEGVWSGLVERMTIPIRRALSDAKVVPSDVDVVLLVGGATRMRCVGELAATLFGRVPLTTLPADEAVALGAAVQGGLIANDEAVEDLVVTDVAPFTLGTSVVERYGYGQVGGVFSPIIDRGTVVPTSRVKRYHALASAQTRMNIEVYQGEHSTCAENHLLGALLVQDLVSTDGYPPSVDVRFSYDISGLLEVEACDVATGNRSTLVLENPAGRLSEEQRKESLLRLSRLKFHPRESLPNTAALARAEGLYLELTGAEREELGRAMAHFRAVLEDAERADVERARGLLLSVLKRLIR